MNEPRIEELLRKSPRVIAPEGLLERLNGDINLPRGQIKPIDRVESIQFYRRWFPALSFGVLVLGCLITLAVQTNQFVELRRENESLRAASAHLDQLRAENQELKRFQMQSQDLDRLRHDNSDLRRLLQEIGRLRAQLQDWEKLRAENQRLRAESLATGTSANTEAKSRSIEEFNNNRCVHNLKQIGLSMRLWAQDNDNVYTSDFLSMTNELSTPILLQCPSDKSRTVKTWSDVAVGNVSYRMLSPRFDLNKYAGNFHYVVVALCPIHGNLTLADGAVEKVGADYQSHLKVIEGKTMFAP